MCQPEYWNTPLIKQIWVESSIVFMMLGHGMLMAMTSSMLPAIQAPDSPIKVDLEQGSWLSASVGVGCVVMYFGSSFLMATLGRRRAMLLGLVPAIISPIICYFATEINVLIFGRFLGGVGFGGTGFVGAVVIGEYTSPEYRGVFLNFKSAALYMGCTIIHILGHFFHWRTAALAIIVPYILNFCMAYTWPESPAWLASKKKYEECTQSFYWLRGKSESSTRELVAMITAQKEQAYEIDKTFCKAAMMLLKKFKKRNFLKPMAVLSFLALLLESTGRHVFPAYALLIINEIDPDKSKAFYYNLCIDFLMCASAGVSTILVKLMKRRTLLFSSGISSVVVLLTVCLCYYLQSKSLISQKYDAVPLFLFLLYFVLVNIGCTPICLTLAAEIFPLEHRPTGSAISGIIIALIMTATLKITPAMLVTIKVYGTFAVYGVSMAVCVFILYFILPETKDQTMQEIEDNFNDDGFKRREEVRDEEGRLADVDNRI